MARFRPFVAILWFGAFTLATESWHIARADEPPSAWTALAPHFQPPKELADDFGDFESPLLKTDGTEVANASEWAARRLEILRRWRLRLGDWPPPLEKPALKILATERRENFTQHEVIVDVAAPPLRGSGTDRSKPLTSRGYLLIPDGKGPFPAVLVPFYEPKTSAGLKPDLKGHHDYGLQLAKRGYLVLCIGTPGGNEAGSDTREALNRIGENYRCQPLGFLAHVASNGCTLLTQREDVDPARIGAVGLSYGGKWAMFASCLDERFACAVWGDPGIVFDESNSNINYYEPWYLGYDFHKEMNNQRPRGKPDDAKPRTGLYRELIEQKKQLVDLHALMAPRPVLVSGGTEDKVERWKALNHLVKLNKLLGHENRVGLTLRETHVPDANAAEQTCLFFDHFLKAKRTEKAAAAPVDAKAGEDVTKDTPAGNQKADADLRVEQPSDGIAPILLSPQDRTSMKHAIRRGLAVLTKGAANYPNNRDCFSCHHQTLPLLAMTSADRFAKSRRKVSGANATEEEQFPLDKPLAASISAFTHKTFAAKHESLKAGTGIGGKALTVGYGLWTLDLADHPRDATTDAMVAYLLKTQEDEGHWKFHSFRPPASSSVAMTTAVAIYGLKAYGPDAVDPQRLNAAYARAAQWTWDQSLAQWERPNATTTEWFGTRRRKPESHEERIGRDWLTYLLREELYAVWRSQPARALNTEEDELAAMHDAAIVNDTLHPVDGIEFTQQHDGGWGQEPGMASDAYATGQSLLMLAQLGDGEFGGYSDKFPVQGDAAFRRGVAFLLNTQQPDGSWHVKTRAKPVQTYFDNGDPHGKDQFLSMMATSWAVSALSNALTRDRKPLDVRRNILPAVTKRPD